MTTPDSRSPRARRLPLVWGALTAAGLAGLVLSACSTTTPGNDAASKTTSTPGSSSVCPLTGLPAPGGTVPQRPALGVKVDNYPRARPQSGLDKADIVFEEPVEGGITRYVAVFQCQNAALVGPVRSARNVDIGILGEFGHPLLAHVGGIDPVLANIKASPLVNVDLGTSPSLQIHPPGRVAPYSTYSSTALLYGTHPTMTTPPRPVFTYSPTPPAGGTPVSTVSIDFSDTSNVTWRYNPSLTAFQRFFNADTPDVLQNGVQNTAANVIVQYVQISYGPWLENAQGGREVQADLYPNASGTAVVYRDGEALSATWHRTDLGSPTQFLDAAGTPIALQPGQTWVELVPNTILASTTP